MGALTQPARERLIRSPEVAEERAWTPAWCEAVDAFVRELREAGFSEFTLRDYRLDVMRLGSWLEIDPVHLTLDHLREAAARLESLGTSLPSRRRRLSAYRKFHVFVLRRHAGPRAPVLIARIRSAELVDRLVVACVYFAGLRLHEVAELEVRDVRLRRRELVVRSGFRLLPLHPGLDALLAEARDLFPRAPFRPLIPGAHGFPLHARTLHGRFHRLVLDVGLQGLRPELLRREASRFLLADGAPPGLIKAFLGRDRGRPLAPRRGRFVDLTCLAERLARLPGIAPLRSGAGTEVLVPAPRVDPVFDACSAATSG